MQLAATNVEGSEKLKTKRERERERERELHLRGSIGFHAVVWGVPRNVPSSHRPTYKERKCKRGREGEMQQQQKTTTDSQRRSAASSVYGESR